MPSQIYPSVEPQVEVKSIETEVRQVELHQIRPQPSRQQPERDDWFVQFDAIREETVVIPAGIQLIYICTHVQMLSET